MSKSPILLNKLSLDSDVPLYAQLVGIVKRNISAGTLSAGDLLPSETELCKAFDISRSTVRQAIGALEGEGMVVRKQGRGTFVSEPKLHRKTDTVYSFTSEISAMGLTPSSTLLEFDVIPPTAEIVNILELNNAESSVYRFSRLRNVNGEPFILETSYYPQYIYPHLTRELLQTHSFYSLLYEVGIVPFSAVDSYRAVTTTQREAELLGCEAGSAAFSAERRTKTESGMIYEFTRSLIRSDRVSLNIVLSRDGTSFSRKVDK